MESSIRASRPTRRASITPALILLFCSAASGEQQDHQQRDYPRGAGAMPLLHEAWSFSAGNIYPESLASAFDTERLAELEHELRSDEELGLADVLNPFLETLGVSHTRFLDTRHQTY